MCQSRSIGEEREIASRYRMEIKNRDKGSIRRVLIPFPRILLNLGISRIFRPDLFLFFFSSSFVFFCLGFLNLGISRIFDLFLFESRLGFLNLGISRIFDSISFGFFFFELRLRFLNLGISKIFDSISFDFFFFELCLFLGFLNFGNL